MRQRSACHQDEKNRARDARTQLPQQVQSAQPFPEIEIHGTAPRFRAIHRIDQRSPLFGANKDLLKQQQVLLVVSLTSLDETLLQTVASRHVYYPDEILFGKRFEDILKLTNDGTMRMIDSSQFDLVVQDQLPGPIAKTTDAYILLVGPNLRFLSLWPYVF